MEEILKTTLLDFERSTFIIDLVKHNNGKQYIRILQTIENEESNNKRVLKINPSLLSNLLEVLTSYKELLILDEKENQLIKQISTDTVTTKLDTSAITESSKKAIQSRYLKGVSIDDLTIQFDCKAELIEQVLRNSNIEIVNNNQPKPFHYKKNRRRKR